jgi:N-acetylglucosaminyldiphosphoundecaprenol N-acetyl-beta-D-mannosaminyltransferase
VAHINDSGADILFVSLGAPKQENWMADHKGRIKPVQLGVGAAFSFITGRVKLSPSP